MTRGTGRCIATMIVASALLVGARTTSASAVSGVSAECSSATAKQLALERKLNPFGLDEPIVQTLCGPFTGPGSNAMAITLSAPTCWSPQGWAVLTFAGGDWQLVLERPLRFLAGPLVAIGSDIRETVTVVRHGDSRCSPSGGTRARLWHWDGTRLVAGPFKQVTPGVVRPRGRSCSGSRPCGSRARCTTTAATRAPTCTAGPASAELGRRTCGWVLTGDSTRAAGSRSQPGSAARRCRMASASRRAGFAASRNAPG